jgi:hypothetical protein
MKRLKEVRLKLWLIPLIIATIVFVMMGTLTALWQNPYFIRMTPVTGLDYLILSLESMLIGLFFGIPTPRCASKKAGIGGVFEFLVSDVRFAINSFFYFSVPVLCSLILSRFVIM